MWKNLGEICDNDLALISKIIKYETIRGSIRVIREFNKFIIKLMELLLVLKTNTQKGTIK